jgi:hypothetical protein
MKRIDLFADFLVKIIIVFVVGAVMPDFRSQKTNLVQRTQLRHAFHVMLEQEEPIVAFIEI